MDSIRIISIRTGNLRLISRWVVNYVRQKLVVVPTVLSLAYIDVWTGLFFPATVKSTLPFETQGHCQA